MKRKYLVPDSSYQSLFSIVFKAIQLLDRIYNIVIINLIVHGNEKYRKKLHFILQEIKIERIVLYITILFFLVFYPFGFI